MGAQLQLLDYILEIKHELGTARIILNINTLQGTSNIPRHTKNKNTYLLDKDRYIKIKILPDRQFKNKSYNIYTLELD